MPTITRVMIKAALVYAIAGMALMAAGLMELAQPLHPLLRFIQPTALHLIVVGWLTQMIFGVALWMFPPWSKAEPRGPSGLAWSCFTLLNAGLVMRLIAEPLNSYAPMPVWGWALVLSAVAQTGAVWLFIALTWRRVRARAGATRP